MWMEDHKHSSIHILSKETMDGLSDDDVQSIFRTKHVVVKNQFQPRLRFDEKGLKSLADLKKIVTVHGV